MQRPRAFNLGSVNIDHVHHLPQFVRPGESLVAQSHAQGPGGKGLNQTVALSRSGVPVTHIGKIGRDGDWLRAMLHAEGADFRHISQGGTTGHAIIQIGPGAENAIPVHADANRETGEADLLADLAEARPGDWFLSQNETSCVAEGLALAAARGLRTAWNPAPFDPAARDVPLGSLAWLIVTETEAADLSGEAGIPAALDALRHRTPSSTIFVNLGAFLRGFPLAEAAKVGCLAAAAAVSKHGPADSIPGWGDLDF